MAAWRDSAGLDDPIRFAVAPVAAAKTALQTWQFLFSRLPSEPVTLNYRYQRAPVDVTDAATDYLPGAPIHCRTHEAAALAEAERYAGRTEGVEEANFREAMVDSIEADRDTEPVEVESLTDAE